MNTPIVHLDARTFQTQLIKLTETVAQKVKREAPGLLPGVPAFVSFDLHILIRQAMRTYDLFFYLNADGFLHRGFLAYHQAAWPTVYEWRWIGPCILRFGRRRQVTPSQLHVTVRQVGYC